MLLIFQYKLVKYLLSLINNRPLYLLTNQIAHQGFWIFNWVTLPLDSEDGFRTGCRNVSH